MEMPDLQRNPWNMNLIKIVAIDWKIDVAAILFLLVQNRQQTNDWTLIGSGANGVTRKTNLTVFKN